MQPPRCGGRWLASACLFKNGLACSAVEQVRSAAAVRHLGRGQRPLGLTLVELLVVISILAILAGLAASSLSDAGTTGQLRRDLTADTITALRRACLASDSWNDTGGMPVSFVSDIGRLPLLQGSDPLTQLSELWQRPTGVVAFGPQSLPAGDPDADIQVMSGWRGPYLQLPVGSSVLRDGWGRPLAISASDDGQVLSVQSLGADGVSGTQAADPFSADVPTTASTFLATDVRGPLVVRLEQADGQPLTGGFSVRLFEPDPATGALRVEPRQRLAELTNGHTVRFDDVPVGLRVVRVRDLATSAVAATRSIAVVRGGTTQVIRVRP